MMVILSKMDSLYFCYYPSYLEMTLISFILFQVVGFCKGPLLMTFTKDGNNEIFIELHAPPVFQYSSFYTMYLLTYAFPNTDRGLIVIAYILVLFQHLSHPN